MKNKLKKCLIITLALIFTISAVPFSASAFSDVSTNAEYYDALNRLTALGVVSGGSDKFNPEDTLTREQFAKMIVVAAGLEDTALALKGSTQFPDISATAWSTGYINAALSKNYINGMLDGKFHPTESITYSQMCTILVRALGYTSTAEVPGTWPSNYIAKAATLGLSGGILLKASDAVPRWAAVTMIDKLLSTNVSSTISGTASKTFIETTGYYTKALILGNDKTLSSLTDKQVLTNSGTYYNMKDLDLQPGNTYYVAIKDATITKASGSIGKTLDISVDYIADKRITYSGDDIVKSMVLPENVTYYYNGVISDVNTVANAIQRSSSIVFTYNKAGTAYEYAMVFDPVMSRPLIAKGFVPSLKTLGSFIFDDGSIIIKDGTVIDITSIMEKDVVYSVTDIWNNNGYFQVYDDRVAGEITAVTPNKLSPRTLQIDNVDYQFSQDIDASKLVNMQGAFTVGNNILIYLGEDSKIVNVEYFGAEDNSGYGLVLANSMKQVTNANGTKSTVYYAKIISSDGVTGTYKCGTNASEYKGKLVSYTFTDNETVAISRLSYNYPSSVTINKDQRLLNGSYVSDNVKVFNILYDDTGSELTAEILSWSDIPGGKIADGKILYTSTSGIFEDVNVILTNDLLNERYKMGIVKDISHIPSGNGTTYSYTMLIGGKEYTYNTYIEGANVGDIVSFKMSNSGISSVLMTYYSPSIKGTKVQAVDSRRIKMNDKIYFFNSSMGVYFRKSTGEIERKTLADIDTSISYAQIGLYMNASTDKVEVIYVYE